MTQKLTIDTGRRKTAYYRLGDPASPTLVLVHGNASSSAFFFPTILKLAEHFDVVAPDLNGFGDTEASPVHAPTALSDWAEDVGALMDALQVPRFALLGWSLGGGVAWRFALDHPQRLTHLILLSPMSPYGFGGTRGAEGTPYDGEGWGSPGGFANPDFIRKLAEKDRGDGPMTAREVLGKSLFAAGWPLDREWQDLFVDELLKVRMGEDYYPGDFRHLPAFPYVLPGARGISNALSPQYADVSAFAAVDPKPPVLWIHGDKDLLVSDRSMSDLATLGLLGLLSGYPGEEAFPPQPMVSQTRAVLEKYRVNGGSFREVLLEGCAHAAHLEAPERFVAEVADFIDG